MSERNANSFKDLNTEQQQRLLAYIADNYSKTKNINYKHTAYGLKQHYTRIFVDKELHVTSRCFMEAMLEAGFQAKPIDDASEPNWYFNVSVKKTKS